MSLLTCEEKCTLVQFARAHQVHQRDLWLPLDALLPPHSRSGACVTVEPRTPIALLESATDSLSLDKRSICVRMQVANAMECESRAVDIDPSLQPSGFAVFVRWDRKGTKHLHVGMQLLHYGAAGPDSSSSPTSLCSSVAGQKHGRGEGAADVIAGTTTNSNGASTLADSLRGTQKRLSLLQRSTEDLQQRLSAAVQATSHPPHPHSLQILTSTLASIRHRSAQPPLHFVVPAAAEAVEAGGVVWARSNRRILSRVFRAAASEERSTASRYSDGSRRLRFYFVDDVLLRRPKRWASVARSAAERGEGALAGEDSGGSENDVELLLKEKVLEDMNEHFERGYRIVFLDHYPVLHHGSRHALESTLAPIVRLCKECCPHVTVTVVVSAMSYVTAVGRQGMDLSFVLPQSGLLRFFVAEMNTSLQPDPQASAVVGSDARGSPFLSSLHREFARNASLTYVDVASVT